jgi:hypothetical protein
VAQRIQTAPDYFDSTGSAGEDLALIEFAKPVSTVRPFKIFNKTELKAGLPITLVAHKQMAETTLRLVKGFSHSALLMTDGLNSGMTLGDSAGAILVKVRGEYELAGILLYDVEQNEKRPA